MVNYFVGEQVDSPAVVQGKSLPQVLSGYHVLFRQIPTPRSSQITIETQCSSRKVYEKLERRYLLNCLIYANDVF